MDLFFILLAVYGAALIYISWRASKNETEEGFLMADRQRTWWQVGLSKYAASVGAAWFVAYAGFAYEYGWPIILVFFGIAVGSVLYARWAVPRIRTTETSGAYTQGDFVYAKTKSMVAKHAFNAVVTLAGILTILVVAISGASLLESFGLMSYEVAVMFTMAVVVGYIFLSGFRAVMLTDVLQGSLLLILVVLVVVGLLNVQPVTLDVLTESRDITVVGTIILMLFGFLSIFGDPVRFQITYAGENNKSVSKGMMFVILPLIFTGLALYLVGNSVYLLDSTLDAARVFPVALSSYLPTIILPFGFLLFFVAIMSTADSFIYSLASHSAQLFSKKRLNKILIRRLIVLYGVLVTVIALYFRDLADVVVLLAAMALVIAVPIMYLIAAGKSGMRFVLLLSGGFVGMVVGVMVVGMEPDAGAFVFLGFIVSSLIPAKWLERKLA